MKNGSTKSNSFIQLLKRGNQNQVGQLINSLSQQITKMNEDNLRMGTSSLFFFFFDRRSEHSLFRPRWNSSINYFHLRIGIIPFFFFSTSVQSFGFAGIRERIEHWSQSSRISSGISRQSSRSRFKIHSNSIDSIDTINSIDKSIDPKCSRETPVGNATLRLPSQGNLSLDPNQSGSLRVRSFFVSLHHVSLFRSSVDLGTIAFVRFFSVEHEFVSIDFFHLAG